MTDPARAIPVLASLDLAQSKLFYEEKLGFKVELFGDYMIARRDEMEIHFWLANDRIYPEGTSCYIRGGQVPALYEEYARKGIGKAPIDGERISDFAVRPWGMKEFYVWDPHGNLLKFGMSADEA
ncbi:putative bleomycin resistance protein [Parvibaculum lavamentivorans DS-1]|uniref:Putative bleomycin resistance protein n=1 Tax=Parvibaculum lavamentivorans (strain DS-1 / DSM 13023 / NCIMB 13966) TaxID=402881 RepID=A7HV31_PARL1|nr:VOC family protein [Parvibaculum lavamentivorans]ABS63764.1 putative bleomycin resistance protein [Parvibaculum lavamentivorans DS-1]